VLFEILNHAEPLENEHVMCVIFTSCSWVKDIFYHCCGAATAKYIL